MLYRYQNECYTTCECMCLYISIYVIICAIQIFYAEYVCRMSVIFVCERACVHVCERVCVCMCVYMDLCACVSVCV